MTHDELLAVINPMTNDDAIFMKGALRTVVELHSPVTEVAGTLKGLFCSHCDYYYPCPTIETIEKELQ